MESMTEKQTILDNYSKDSVTKKVLNVLLRGYCYSHEEARQARLSGKLLCMRLDTNYSCNLNCHYCYSAKKCNQVDQPMPLDLTKTIIDQACEMGLRSVVYLGGGEPLCHSDFLPVVEHIAAQSIIPVIFTNGTLINQQIAKQLFELGASVIIKFDGFKETQDMLTCEGTFERIQRGLAHLLDAGFPDRKGNETRLGAAPCACKTNYREIPEIWRKLRTHSIFPNIERATAVDPAYKELVLDNNEAKWLHETLRRIDREEFDIDWDTVYSSMPNHNCYMAWCGCHITAEGGVSACPELPPVANIATDSLKAILSKYPFNALREIENKIDEPCYSCRFLHKCLGGCRAKAFYKYESLFAQDPLCPLSSGNKCISSSYCTGATV